MFSLDSNRITDLEAIALRHGLWVTMFGQITDRQELPETFPVVRRLYDLVDARYQEVPSNPGSAELSHAWMQSSDRLTLLILTQGLMQAIAAGATQQTPLLSAYAALLNLTAHDVFIQIVSAIVQRLIELEGE